MPVCSASNSAASAISVLPGAGRGADEHALLGRELGQQRLFLHRVRRERKLLQVLVASSSRVGMNHSSCFAATRVFAGDASLEDSGRGEHGILLSDWSLAQCTVR